MPTGRSSGDAGTGEECGEQVALVARRVRQEASRIDRSASAADDDERKVFARMFVSVFQAGVPHHIMMQLSSRVPSPLRRLAIFFTM